MKLEDVKARSHVTGIEPGGVVRVVAVEGAGLGDERAAQGSQRMLKVTWTALSARDR